MKRRLLTGVVAAGAVAAIAGMSVPAASASVQHPAARSAVPVSSFAAAFPAGHLVQTANGPEYSCGSSAGIVVSESAFPYAAYAGGVNNPVLLSNSAATNWCGIDDGGGWYLIAQANTNLCWAEDAGVSYNGQLVNELRLYTCSATAPWEKWGVPKPGPASTWLFYEEHDNNYLTETPLGGEPDALLYPYTGALNQDWTN